ncbi:hypothetical protein O8B39_06490 [Agrobacterium rhizogenes]|nr:hypothetical protein [Rhizobium rhizogenes]
MRFQLKDIAVCVALVVAGGAISPGTISGDASRVLATFLGLFAASVLPTVTLLVNTMTGSGRSIQAIDKLAADLEIAMDAMFFLFGCIGISIASLLMLSIEPPVWLRDIPYITSEVLPRIGQMLVIAPAGIVVWRAGQITGILRQCLKTRHEIAKIEAKAKLEKNVPSSASVKQSFATHREFGRVVSLQDAQKSAPDEN